jgi:hypothetical protein
MNDRAGMGNQEWEMANAESATRNGECGMRNDGIALLRLFPHIFSLGHHASALRNFAGRYPCQKIAKNRSGGDEWYPETDGKLCGNN